MCAIRCEEREEILHEDNVDSTESRELRNVSGVISFPVVRTTKLLGEIDTRWEVVMC